MIDFVEVRRALEGGKASLEAQACLQALSDAPTLPIEGKDALRALAGELGGTAGQGGLVLECLRAGPLSNVHAWASGLAPRAFPPNFARAQGRAAELYGDCFLALSEWVEAWNLRLISARRAR